MWVSPFRYPRIMGYLLLPVAFRSLSRLSSALSAKASTLRSFQLNLLRSESGYRMKVIGLASSLAEDDWFQPVAICEAKALIDEVDKITGSYLIRGCFQSLRPQRRTLRSWFFQCVYLQNFATLFLTLITTVLNCCTSFGCLYLLIV